jgi:DNA (cytosine-5)-methyltransferase 1
MIKQFNYIDIFAGAGGLSEGFINKGYLPIAHIEKDKDACNTLRTRACFYYLQSKGRLNLYYDYLNGEIARDDLYNSIPQDIISSVIEMELSSKTMTSLFTQIQSLMESNRVRHIDLLVGGPPCQAYSIIGRARKCMKNDSRNHLYKLYSQVLKKLKPKMFVFENVPGLLTAGNGNHFNAIMAELSEAGYEIDHKLLNASNFGVLQNRERLIIVGWRKELNGHYPVCPENLPGATLMELFQDLSPIQPGQKSLRYKTTEIPKYLKTNGIRTCEDVLTWHIARKHNERDQQIYRTAIKEWQENRLRLKYSDLPDHLSTHKNKTGFQDRYKVVAGDLETSQTITAHISKDGHYFIHPDLSQARSISVREAARIQSFPDSFFFEGSRTSAFKQIGNAVPPLMARGIASGIKDVLLRINE